MTKEELYKVTDILNDVLSNYLRGSEAEEVIAKLEESVEDSELIKEEPVSEGLEEFVWKYAGSHAPYDSCMQEVKDAVKAGANWQKQQDQSTIELAEDHAMLAGMEKMKQQLLAKAVDGKILANGMGNPILHLWDKGRHLIDKKVKVIIIKKD